MFLCSHGFTITYHLQLYHSFTWLHNHLPSPLHLESLRWKPPSQPASQSTLTHVLPPLRWLFAPPILYLREVPAIAQSPIHNYSQSTIPPPCLSIHDNHGSPSISLLRSLCSLLCPNQLLIITTPTTSSISISNS